MTVNTTERYGLRLMLLLAVFYMDNPNFPEPQSLSNISKSMNVSRQYIANIIAKLRDSGLVKPIRGKYGGYILARHPQNISFFGMMDSLGEKVSRFECVANSSTCSFSKKCPRRNYWEMIESDLEKALAKHTLFTAVKYFCASPQKSFSCKADNKMRKKTL